ncbi:MAG: co-chaperone GroES [bacterium]
MKKNIKPLYDKVLIQRVESESTSSGGIIIPDSAQEKTQIGLVKAVGQGKVNNDGILKPLIVKEGDSVLFGKYSGTEIKLDGQEYLIIREDELLGIIQ